MKKLSLTLLSLVLFIGMAYAQGQRLRGIPRQRQQEVCRLHGEGLEGLPYRGRR